MRFVQLNLFCPLYNALTVTATVHVLRIQVKRHQLTCWLCLEREVGASGSPYWHILRAINGDDAYLQRQRLLAQ
ncbi:hypothetical protein GCM10007158_35010 [Vreelandella hamiltonii]|uniref:Secreted protein n=1 Tax=Halomonas johnsoniae TaxID=502832 RepID=A0ABQ2WWA7_9GAMM|nr:hypothetical protein GCM10007158_35010 [Halomonas johnsoniae]